MRSARNSRRASQATPLNPCDPEALRAELQQIQSAIARRAYELFEARNCEHGHDWEDWFQAESELLRPVSVAMSERPDSFSIRANILGFAGAELKVSIEAQSIAIVGRKDVSPAAATDEAAPTDSYPDLILRLIPLPAEIDPEGAAVELQSGVLRFELPKVGGVKEEAITAGAA